MNPVQVMPTLNSSERDGDGRLVKLIFDSTPPLPAPEVNPWLIAIDGSDNALRAITHTANQVNTMNACALHLVHVQSWLAKGAAETQLAHLALEATAQARALLDKRKLPWRLHALMGEPADLILEQATRLHVNIIVIGSRGLNAVEGLLFGSVAYKIVHLARLPVLVVP